MRIALLADIHANRQAFEACLTAAEAADAEQFVLLGDYVGYGADPAWCLERVRQLHENGAIVIRGNHDAAVASGGAEISAMQSVAGQSVLWTRTQLDASQRAWLGELPLEHRDEDRYYVHADASAPARWRYVEDPDDARSHFAACPARLSFCGHVHRPALYSQAPGERRVNRFAPATDYPLPLLTRRRWLTVAGSVGQPRDGDRSAAWCLLDTTRNALRFLRTPYDIDTAMASIRAAGLPEVLAQRLAGGY
ncbi:metallophosphoesterase family protein [Xanthomonadaceae bacterium XH05]|nr:metallophosphoesterase family protein [Xanthomonadaceae bacterium XH05]